MTQPDELSQAGFRYAQLLHKAGRREDVLTVLASIHDPRARELEKKMVGNRRAISVRIGKAIYVIDYYLLGFGVGILFTVWPLFFGG